jgi:hypothetical protein
MMYAMTPDQSLLWWAIRQGSGAGQFVPNAATAAPQATPGRWSIRRQNLPARLSPRRATHVQPSIG